MMHDNLYLLFSLASAAIVLSWFLFVVLAE
jgi:hypothetical protein